MADTHYPLTYAVVPGIGLHAGTEFHDFAPQDPLVIGYGGAKTITTDSKFYGASITLDGTNDYLLMRRPIEIYTADYCVEGWLKISAYGSTRAIVGLSSVSGSTRWSYYLKGTDNVLALYNGTVLVTGNAQYPVGQWFHFAFAKADGTYRLFQNGVLVGSVTNSTSIAPSLVYVGQSSISTEYLPGNLNDFRITVGAARYTSNFTPPTQLIKSISGQVLSDTGVGAARKVFAVPRAAPTRAFQTESSAIGDYQLLVPDTEYSVVCLDDTAGATYNDLIVRATPT